MLHVRILGLCSIFLELLCLADDITKKLAVQSHRCRAVIIPWYRISDQVWVAITINNTYGWNVAHFNLPNGILTSADTQENYKIGEFHCL